MFDTVMYLFFWNVSIWLLLVRLKHYSTYHSYGTNLLSYLNLYINFFFFWEGIFILTCWLLLFTFYGFELLCNGISDAQRNGLEQANICFFTDLPSCQSHNLENCFPNSKATGHFTTTILAREVPFFWLDSPIFG